MFRVMIRDSMSSLAGKILEATGKIEVVVDDDKANNDPKVLANLIRDFDGIAVRSGTRITKQVLDNADRLKVIGRAGVGVDNIDTREASRKGIVVMNAPGGNTVTTAEHTISLMLSLARNIPQATASLRDGRWEKKQLLGVEITGKTLGVIGLGNIGRVVANRARGLKMEVIAYDPMVSDEAARAIDVKMVSQEEVLATSDFITLHVPRMKETENLIDAAALASMKPGVRLINCSRGEVVNLNDLYTALLSGHVAGAALDVFPTEPPDMDLPLLQHPNVVFTPHLGASTGEAQSKVAEMIARQMSAYLLDGVITNAVNFPSISQEVMEQIRPHLNLAEKMGSLMGQLTRKIRDIRIIYSGDVASLDTRLLTHGVLKGYLGVFTDSPVNHVSAPALASEKGIRFSETIIRETDDFAGTIRLEMDGQGEGPDEIWGAIFSKKYPRIVRLGMIYMDALPEGYMIIIQNIDKPGVIGNVGTTLGKHNINIGRYQLGRLKDRALCMVNIDHQASEEVLKELSALPNILSVQQVDLG